MGFATPLGLLGLLAVPAVLALHLFRRQLRPRRIAGLFLFAPDAQAAQAGRRRAKLQRTASLWLELAAACALGLWLGGLTVGAAGQQPHLVAVLDDSASMGALGLGDTAERARLVIRSAANKLPANAVVTLITTGPRPEIELGPRAPIAELDAALARYAPQRTAHDPGPALDLGRELAATDTLLFVTDQPGVAAPPQYRVEAVGRAEPNAAILATRRVTAANSPETELVYVDLRAWGARPLPTRVRILAEGQTNAPLAERTVTLEPGRTTHLSLEVRRTDRALEVALGEDALHVDNTAVLLPEPLKQIAVANLLPDAASATLQLDRLLTAVPSVVAAADPATAHLVLTTAAGVLAPWTTELVIGPTGPTRDTWLGPFLIERRHSLLGGVTLEGVVWGAGHGHPPGLPLILAGSQALLCEEVRADATRLHLNLDPTRTNLPASPDWPILVSNICESVRSRLPGRRAANARVGELLEYRHAGPAAAVHEMRLVDPAGRRLPARGRRRISWEARLPGLHHLLAGETELTRFAVHFVDARESDLTLCGESSAEPRPGAEAEVDQHRPAEDHSRVARDVLALLLLLAIALDWFVLSRGPS